MLAWNLVPSLWLHTIVIIAMMLAFPLEITSARELAMSLVGDPGNQPDVTGRGSVPYIFRIGTYEVTHADYAEFLNSVATIDDPHEVYIFALDVSYWIQGGIRRLGEPGSYNYVLQSQRDNFPVSHISFWNALRFANWLHNGKPKGIQGPGTTEDGAYTLTPEAIAANTVFRNPGARYFLPNDNEWYKAAYYKGGTTDAGYWAYPTRSDEPPHAERPPGHVNTANFDAVVFDKTKVGSYSLSPGPYGTFDQAGNVWEWVEDVEMKIERRQRGGSMLEHLKTLEKSWNTSWYPNEPFGVNGFRVASLPEPGAVTSFLFGVFIACAQVRHRRRPESQTRLAAQSFQC